MGRGAARTSFGLLATALLAGCTSGDRPAAAPETSASPSPASGQPTSDPTPSGDPATADDSEHTQPWVVVSSLRRPRLHLTVSEARALAHGRGGAALDTIRKEAGGHVS